MKVRWWRVACACAVLAALWLALAARGARAGHGARLHSRRAFPRLAPHALAHRLADFSTLPLAAPHKPDPGSWRVEEQRGNFTSWRYVVTWSCGARCAGRAAVAAHARPAGAVPQHAPAAAHDVTLQLRVCADAVCDEMEIEAGVGPDGAGGAELRETARAWCGEAPDDAACAARLRTHRAQHHDILERAA